MVHVARDRATSILKEFRGFILRGNVVDLAVAVAVGAAFTAVVNSLVAAFITPIVGAFVGKDFAKLAFEINGSQFQYGLFINALITFLITAAAVFFLVVKPLHALMVRLEMVPAEPMPSSECPSCLTEIPTASKRCRACTSELEVGWAGPES
jgi:large conductance mechanosensitive channel